MKQRVIVVFAGLALGAGAGAALAQTSQSTRTQPLAIAEQGDFYVGGVVVLSPATSSSGEGDPNPGHVVVDQVYVQYQIPAQRKYRLPLILATTLLPLRSMKSLLIALQYHHMAAEGRLIDREPK